MHEHGPERDNEATDPTAASAEQNAYDRPRIYVADLAAYNNGQLHGRWIDATDDDAQLAQAVTEMLAASPIAGAEEWAIHDYDGFGLLRLGEYESLATISGLAGGIAAHGIAFAAFADWLGVDAATDAAFTEHYRGSWQSVEDYAEALLRDLGTWEMVDQLPAWLQPYVRVDVPGFSRDLQLGGDIYAVEHGEEVHIFDCHV